MPFGNATENFLILDIAPAGTNGLFLHMTGDREVVLEKFERDIDLGKFLASPVRRMAQASWEGQYLFDGHRKILAAADSSLATTIPMPFTFCRGADRRLRPITLEELDDQIGQMMPKLVSQCHMEAAHRFGDDAVEAVLVGAVAKCMTIDGKATTHPLGFLGDEVRFTLECTFVRRTIFEHLRPLFNSPEPFFFAESAQVRLDVLASVRPLPLNLVVAPDGGADAALYILQKVSTPSGKREEAVLYRERFSWSFESAVAALQSSFSLSRSAARDIYAAYIEDDMSDDAKWAVRDIFSSSAERFESAIRKTKIRGRVYLDASFPSPFSLPYQAGQVIVEDVPFDELCAKFGIVIRDFAIPQCRNAAISGAVLWRHFAPFLKMYFDHDQAAVNGLLRKRVHWLTE